MAWVGIFIGMMTGLLAAVLGYAAMDWPLWASALLYPAAGSMTAVLVILLLAVSAPHGGAGSFAGSARKEPAAV